MQQALTGAIMHQSGPAAIPCPGDHVVAHNRLHCGLHWQLCINDFATICASTRQSSQMYTRAAQLHDPASWLTGR
jgi:hypothetical protein